MNRETPACLYFSKQDSLCVWDVKTVLDALERKLKQDNISYKRHDAEQGKGMGHIDIYCTHEDIARKFRNQYQEIRGTV